MELAVEEDEEGGGIMALQEVADTRIEQYPTRISGLDAALAGGIPELAVTLLAGEPGIGKSTLLLQVGHALCDRVKTLYMSSEEPLERIKARARTLGNIAGRLLVLHECDPVRVKKIVHVVQPAVLLVDSLHGMALSVINGRPGSPAQVQSAAYILRHVGDGLGFVLPMTVIATCHVTKDGSLAGPRDVEHLVDVVLWMEGDPQTPERTLRASKNRFGATTQTGIVTRGDEGFR